MVELVQRRWTGCFSALGGMDYFGWLYALDLFYLRGRRLICDLIRI